MTIEKYSIDTERKRQLIMMPKKHEILCVEKERGRPYIYAEVDLPRVGSARNLEAEGDFGEFMFLISSTGYSFDSSQFDYIGHFVIDKVYQVYKFKQ